MIIVKIVYLGVKDVLIINNVNRVDTQILKEIYKISVNVIWITILMIL